MLLLLLSWFSGSDPDLFQVQQELNARFLQDHRLLPLALPPVPLTLRTEMHQHQHLHHHQHVMPAPYLPSLPGTFSMASHPMSVLQVTCLSITCIFLHCSGKQLKVNDWKDTHCWLTENNQRGRLWNWSTDSYGFMAAWFNNGCVCVHDFYSFLIPMTY